MLFIDLMNNLLYIKIEVDMKKVKYNDSFIYIDDTPVDKNDTGIIFRDYKKEDDLDKTLEVNPISKEDLLSDTITDLWGDSHE